MPICYHLVCLTFGWAFEFTQIPFPINYKVFDVILTDLSKTSMTFPYDQNLVTVIRFLVRVPVLSVQMLFAPPIVSQADKNLTKLF